MAKKEKTEHEKFLDSYLGIEKKLDAGNLHELEDDKITSAYENLHSKDALLGEMGLESHMMGELHNVVKETMGEKVNFQHIKDDRKRRKAATEFVNSMMRFSIEKYYVHCGISAEEAKEKADVVMSNPNMTDAWGNRLWGEKFEGGRSGFINYLMDSDQNIRDFLHPNNKGIYEKLYQPVVHDTDPHRVKKGKLYEEVLKRERKEGMHKYVMKKIGAAVGKDAEGFEIGPRANTKHLMDLAVDLHHGQELTQDVAGMYKKGGHFSKIPDKYKKKEEPKKS